jgi:hypothetical protein
MLLRTLSSPRLRHPQSERWKYPRCEEDYEDYYRARGLRKKRFLRWCSFAIGLLEIALCADIAAMCSVRIDWWLCNTILFEA